MSSSINVLIQLQDISKNYFLPAGVVRVLKNINISIDKGEYVAIMGPSGSGKSTFMNIVGCLDTPTSGVYLLEGKNVVTLTSNQLAYIRNNKIGFVFQFFNLLPRLTALQNVEIPMIYARVGKKERRRTASSLLEFVGLSHRMHHKPNELSGGQKQRVAIARALANRPSIILADEPTGNIDSTTGENIMALFDRVHKEGNTIILVTHEQKVACKAQRIIQINDGTIISNSGEK